MLKYACILIVTLSSCQPQRDAYLQQSQESAHHRVWRLINEYRDTKNLPPIALEPVLCRSAQERAPYASHYAMGQRPEQALFRKGWSGSSVGEIIAQADSPEIAVGLWEHSPSHDGIMRGDFDQMGVGIDGRNYCVMFGK